MSASRSEDSLAETLALRERIRDRYTLERDPIGRDRMTWRAHTLRQMMHILPGQSILELGSGEGHFTRRLAAVTRGENPITAVTFGDSHVGTLPASVECVRANELPGLLAGRRFDFVVALDLLDQRNSATLLRHVLDLLQPGGQVLFYQSNPWNVVLGLRRLFARLAGRPDLRQLLPRTQLYELMSEVGFIRVFAVFNDFVYPPLTRRLAWVFRNLSIVLENAPGVRTLAGSILVHAQAPPRAVERPRVSLCSHRQLNAGVSVVIPCHNEEMNIEPLVEGLIAHYDNYIHQIILVDDNSRDGTRAVIERLAAADPRVRPVFRTPPNGVGRAIADGYRAVSGRWVLSMDCDFQQLLPEFRDLFDAAAEGYDVVVGSRFSRHSVLLNYPFQKIVANRAFHLLAQLVLLRRFRDLTNNLKLLRREVIERLILLEPGFAVNAETGFQPLIMGFSVREVPIAWINRTPDMGLSSFRLAQVGGGYFQVLWRLWRRLATRSGPYGSLATVAGRHATCRGEYVPPSASDRPNAAP